ncbi:hypothetical protein GGTG_12144 [Gaeumannomyces tritici R3-111a-1]|uniref:Uncharacterized protein n=1 Tax=Gaeumannomyces tritici (strain R3-111a-1) TaxID=644352 RepID=J3PF65_GAET3|nr:hypothetical protein GGTG_12144 [Gaeumannomyces tritici R3-111a-1]EJT69967.1 hypothetical protein GGTG_12144 [Gaeumannomyces tritici R3-111a-1]
MLALPFCLFLRSLCLLLGTVQFLLVACPISCLDCSAFYVLVGRDFQASKVLRARFCVSGRQALF